MNARYPVLALVAVVVLVSVSALGCSKSLGTELEGHGCQVFYTEGVPDKTARDLLKFLVDEQFCDGTPKTTQLTRAEDGEWRFRMVAKPEFLDDDSVPDTVELFGAQLSAHVVNGEPVSVELCDSYLQTRKTLPAPRWGAFFARDSCGLFVSDDVTEAEREATLAALAALGQCAAPASFRISRGGSEGLALHAVIQAQARQDPAMVKNWRVVAGEVATRAFGGAPLTLHMTDEMFRPQVTAAAVLMGSGVERGACDVRYASGDLKGQAEGVAGLFEAVGYCTGDTKTYQVSREGEGWRVAAVAGAHMDAAVRASLAPAFRLVAAMLRGQVFGGAATTYAICDAVFEGCQAHVGADLGKVLHREQCHVFYPADGSFPPAAQGALLDLFDAEQLCESEQLARLTRGAEGWLVQLPVADPAVAQSETYGSAAAAFKVKLAAVFDGVAPALVATDLDLKTLKAF